MNALAAAVPELIQGAADLSTSTSTNLKDLGVVERGDYSGRNIYYGVREHAMGAITNGLAAHGGWRPDERHVLHLLRLHEEPASASPR